MKLELYVSGSTPAGEQAESLLRHALNRLEPDRYTLEVIDCVEEPEKAMEKNIIATPALVKHTNSSPQMMIGNFTNTEKLHAFLGIEE